MNVKRAIGCFALAMLTCQGLKAQSDGEKERAYMVQAMLRIADPVLNSLSRNELKKQMPVEAKDPEERKKSTHLEAFGRLIAGMAPWLELGPDDSDEGRLREKYILLVLKGIDHATNPAAADYMNFNQGSQPLVDAAFFAQALLRAPVQLWGRLDAGTRANVLTALKSSRVIKAHQNNWLLFSAEVEAAIMHFEGTADTKPIDVALKQHLGPWYKGDGAYGDGADFHWDYYNSFVIQPMLLEVTKVLSQQDTLQKKSHQLVLKRAKRYAAVQERMISPEGTYPPLGRSLAYRFGAFQLLAQVSLMRQLPKGIAPAQVRSALYTVVKKQLEMPGTFDRQGWLQIGMAGHQPGLGESYISTGSLYLCSEVFLVLGLPASDPFWRGRDQDWTAKKLWKGMAVDIDHSISD
jgi:hypothetical protein